MANNKNDMKKVENNEILSHTIDKGVIKKKLQNPEVRKKILKVNQNLISSLNITEEKKEI